MAAGYCPTISDFPSRIHSIVCAMASAVKTYPPNQTIYIKNLNEKSHKGGAPHTPTVSTGPCTFSRNFYFPFQFCCRIFGGEGSARAMWVGLLCTSPCLLSARSVSFPPSPLSPFHLLQYTYICSQLSGWDLRMSGPTSFFDKRPSSSAPAILLVFLRVFSFAPS